MTLPGHQRTCARMRRADTRMKPKPATNATKKQNSGSRPVSTICSRNQPDMLTPTLAATTGLPVSNRWHHHQSHPAGNRSPRPVKWTTEDNLYAVAGPAGPRPAIRRSSLGPEPTAAWTYRVITHKSLPRTLSDHVPGPPMPPPAGWLAWTGRPGPVGRDRSAWTGRPGPVGLDWAARARDRAFRPSRARGRPPPAPAHRLPAAGLLGRVPSASLRGPAALHGERRAGRHPGGRPSEPDREFGDLGWLNQPLHGGLGEQDGLDDVLFGDAVQPRLLRDLLFDEWRANITGTEAGCG